MHKLTIAATMIAFGAMLGSAQADIIGGAPMKNGNQCFKYSHSQERDGRFGSWGACPRAASTPATQQQQRARRPASR